MTSAPTLNTVGRAATLPTPALLRYDQRPLCTPPPFLSPIAERHGDGQARGHRATGTREATGEIAAELKRLAQG